MSEEKEKKFKIEGEELARAAVDSRMGSKQLQTIYNLVKIKPLPFKIKPLTFVETYIQRQISRALNGRVEGYAGFIKALELLRKYGNDREALEKILMYAVMMYDYIEKEPIMKLRVAGEPMIRRVVERWRSTFIGMDMKLHGKNLDINVYVDKYRNPKDLVTDIEKALKSKEEFSSLNLRVWIKLSERR
jgi:hypothetical protein